MRKNTAVAEIGPYWKVRVVIPGGVLHFASRTEPALMRDNITGAVEGLWWQPIIGTPYGDTPGYIEWSAVVAVTWRPADGDKCDQRRTTKRGAPDG